ncbi:hypothetical protein RVM25_02920, partial [Enterobacter hormaechei subsp. xiangfangensis]
LWRERVRYVVPDGINSYWKTCLIIMGKTCKHTAVSAYGFSALIISPAWNGREADYRMITFSSIKASD